MDIGGSEKDVNTRAGSILQGFPGALDVRAAGAGQSRDDGSSNDTRDGLDRSEISLGGDRESGFDYVDTEAVELMRQPQLLLMVHTAAGRLFSVAQGGVENGDANMLRGGHGLPCKKK